jgi:hypothetical protein
VSVVSTRDVVILAAARVPVQFVTGVPLGLPALSVSIRYENVADGLPVFATHNLRVVAETPVPNTGNDNRVLAVMLPRFAKVELNVIESRARVRVVLSEPLAAPATKEPPVKVIGYVAVVADCV